MKTIYLNTSKFKLISISNDLFIFRYLREWRGRAGSWRPPPPPPSAFCAACRPSRRTRVPAPPPATPATRSTSALGSAGRCWRPLAASCSPAGPPPAAPFPPPGRCSLTYPGGGGDRWQRSPRLVERTRKHSCSRPRGGQPPSRIAGPPCPHNGRRSPPPQTVVCPPGADSRPASGRRHTCTRYALPLQWWRIPCRRFLNKKRL
jgi:hypothetical protein